MKPSVVLSLSAFSLVSTVAYGASAVPPIVVGSVAELEAAMAPENAHRRIVVLNLDSDPGALDYAVHGTLTVPNGATVVGEGVMRFGDDGLPSGFEDGTETRIGAAADFQVMEGRPEIFTVSDGAQLEGLTVVGKAPGNAVGVISSAAGPVSASIRECEVIGPGGPAFGPEGGDGFIPGGPLARGVFIRTRHKDSAVTVRIERSIVRGNGANGVFVINSAAGGLIELSLIENTVTGGLTQLDAVGGASPDGVRDAHGEFLHEVTGATVVVHSYGNHYVGRGLVTDTGITLEGGYDARGFPGEVRPGSSFNRVVLHSVDDRIDHVGRGVFAHAGMRTDMAAGPSSFNDVDLHLLGTEIETLALGSDLTFTVTRSITSLSEPAGEGNTIRVLARLLKGSGAPRNNLYTLAFGDQAVGADNSLVFMGSPEAFERTNQGLVLPPPAEFFVGDASD